MTLTCVERESVEDAEKSANLGVQNEGGGGNMAIFRLQKPRDEGGGEILGANLYLMD